MTWETDDAERKALIAGLKVGDRVLIDLSSNWGVSARHNVVTKITETQIVCGTDRYRKDDGRQITGTGSVYRRPRIAAPSLVPQLERARLIGDAREWVDRAEKAIRTKDFPAALTALREAVTKVERLATEPEPQS